MSTRRDDIRRRLAKRKKEKEKLSNRKDRGAVWAADEERYGFDKLPVYDVPSEEEDSHPLFSKETIMFKVLAAACLFLIVAIMFKNESSAWSGARDFVNTAMEEDFQFAAVSEWYEDQFGKPLAFLPVKEEKNQDDEQEKTAVEPEYALPASAKILEDFSENGQKLVIETDKDAAVTAMSEGLVKFAGVKDGFGKTVIIQHADESESWYGNLSSLSVSLYQYIEVGAELGTTAATEDGLKGSFFFGVKKEDDFVNPIQVSPID